MNAKDQRELIRMAQTGSIDARNDLLESLQPWVLIFCRRRTRGGVGHLDDLVQWCSLQLIRSIDTFDLARDIQPMTYFTRRLAGAIADYWRNLLPAGMRRGVSGTDRVTTKQFGDFSGDSWEWAHPIDEVMVERLEMIDEVDAISELCDSFGEHAEMLRLRFVHGVSMAAIGERIGVSESRISKLISQFVPLIRARYETVQRTGRFRRTSPILTPKESQMDRQENGRTAVQSHPSNDRQPNQAGPPRFDPTQITRMIVNATPADMEALDKTVAEVEQTLASLKEFRKVLSKRLGGEGKPRSSTSSTTATKPGDLVLAYVTEEGPATLVAIAKGVGKSLHSVRITVSRSNSLRVNADGLVVPA